MGHLDQTLGLETRDSVLHRVPVAQWNQSGRFPTSLRNDDLATTAHLVEVVIESVANFPYPGFTE
jgi:hypothetical protein